MFNVIGIKDYKKLSDLISLYLIKKGSNSLRWVVW